MSGRDSTISQHFFLAMLRVFMAAAKIFSPHAFKFHSDKIFLDSPSPSLSLSNILDIVPSFLFLHAIWADVQKYNVVVVRRNS